MLSVIVDWQSYQQLPQRGQIRYYRWPTDTISLDEWQGWSIGQNLIACQLVRMLSLIALQPSVSAIHIEQDMGPETELTTVSAQWVIMGTPSHLTLRHTAGHTLQGDTPDSQCTELWSTPGFTYIGGRLLYGLKTNTDCRDVALERSQAKDSSGAAAPG